MFIDELKRLKRKGVKIKIIIKDKPSQEIMYKLMALGEVKINEMKIIQGSLYADNNISMNIFDKKDGLYATILYYKKCLYCINAWLGREWEMTK